MEISKLSAHNFRSIGDISLTCSSLTTLLGPNNHGKSNVLRALEFGLTTSAKPSTDDFFAHRKADDNTMWVEMTFRDLTPQEKKTFERYLQADGSICIRKSARLLGGDNVETFYNGWVEQPEESWRLFCLPSSSTSEKCKGGADFSSSGICLISDNLSFVSGLGGAPYPACNHSQRFCHSVGRVARPARKGSRAVAKQAATERPRDGVARYSPCPP